MKDLSHLEAIVQCMVGVKRRARTRSDRITFLRMRAMARTPPPGTRWTWRALESALGVPKSALQRIGAARSWEPSRAVGEPGAKPGWARAAVTAIGCGDPATDLTLHVGSGRYVAAHLLGVDGSARVTHGQGATFHEPAAESTVGFSIAAHRARPILDGRDVLVFLGSCASPDEFRLLRKVVQVPARGQPARVAIAMLPPPGSSRGVGARLAALKRLADVVVACDGPGPGSREEGIPVPTRVVEALLGPCTMRNQLDFRLDYLLRILSQGGYGIGLVGSKDAPPAEEMVSYAHARAFPLKGCSGVLHFCGRDSRREIGRKAALIAEGLGLADWIFGAQVNFPSETTVVTTGMTEAAMSQVLRERVRTGAGINRPWVAPREPHWRVPLGRAEYEAWD